MDLLQAESDPTEVLTVRRDLSKEKAIREDDQRSGRRRSGKPMHSENAGHAGVHRTDQSSRVNNPESSSEVKIVESSSTGGGQTGRLGSKTPRGHCFVCGEPGHYKRSCPRREHGEIAAGQRELLFLRMRLREPGVHVYSGRK